MPEFAVSTQLFGAYELTMAHLQMIRRAGFRAVEVFAAPGHFAWEDGALVRRTARALGSLRLEVCSLHAPWAPGMDIASLDAAVRRRSLAAVEQAVDALLELGGNVLILHPGEAPGGVERREEQLQLSEEGIARVADYCRPRQVRVALENPPPDELAGDSASLMRLYARFARDPVVQACFDTGHAHLAPGGVGAVRDLPKELLVVHLSDNRGHGDDHLPPGEGTIPWEELTSALAQRRFAGSLVLELTTLPGPEAILSRGWEWMQRMWPVRSGGLWPLRPQPPGRRL